MKKTLVSLFAFLMLLLPQALQAKVEHLLPLPQQVNVTENAAAFALSGNVTINYAEGVKQCALLEEFFTTNGCTIGQSDKQVNVSLVASIDGAYDYELHGYENEAYTLEITSETISITAVTATGVIRAAQTLTQLAEGWDGTPALEALTMKDWPAFKLRGYMHDVGRSFISIDELVKQVEKFSRFKVNTFHWHLTENQAWRFEVKAYPELTSSESMTRFPGQYYTQEDCKRLMAVAKKHGVIVIPEIDMPGHSEAFERAMGFGMQTEEGKEVLKKVIDEAVEVFAGAPYIHIGGDEVATTAAYLNEMLAYAESKDVNVKGGLWNPINGIGQDALNNTLAQMWGTRGYLASGKANIDCRYNYTNHFDVFADLVGIYKSNIYYHQQGTPEVAGAISGCWNDRKVATEKDIMAQNNVWANVIATAERAWIGGGKQYIDNMTNTPNDLKDDGGHGGVMLPNSGDEYEEFKSWEERFLFHKAHSLEGEPIPYVKQTNVRWRITDAFPNGGSETAAFGPEEAGMTASTDLLPEVFTHEGKTYYTGMATGAGIYLAHTWGNSIIDAYYENPQYNHTAYAWTYVYSPVEQTVGAQIEFQNYSRSEQDGAAPAGKWDHFGSKVWVNGVEIAAPTWDNTGVSISSKEVELKNENFPGRKPIEVALKQGWNKVFLKLPYFNKGYRLKKWMFTCVFTDKEGINAVEGLIYSPNQCLDEATELVAAKISEIKRDRGNLVGNIVGLWPESAAATLDAKVKEIEATYSAQKTAEERAEQVAELEDAWTAFTESLTGDKINLPVSDNYYRMYTPGRENRYPASQGAGNAIIGEQNPMTKASIWQFVSRGDNSYDIINLADGTYISPASNNNSALNAVAAKPSAGWVVKAAGSGKVIITSGNSVQLHQTNNGNGYKLFNWGADSNAGTFNTTDGGCVYQLTDVTAIAPSTPIKQLASYEEFENGGVYNFITARGWMGAIASSDNAISTARTNVSPAADNAYFQWAVYQSKNGNYYLYNIGKQKFMGVQSSNNASVPLVSTPAGKQLTFKASSSTEYPIMFSTDDAGVVNHSGNHGEGLITWTGGWETLNDDGSNHKVTLITKLGDAELAKIADLVEVYDVFEGNEPSALPQVGKYYRIGYDFGGSVGVKYLQSTNSSVKSLAMTDNKGESSIFYVEEVGGKMRLKSHSTGKYLKETGSTRGLHDDGGDVTFSKGASEGQIKIQAPSYLHAGNSNGNCYIDHCSSDGCAAHNFFVEEVVLVSLTVNGPSKVGATATWNGTTKPLPATWAILEGVEITNPTLTINCNGTYTFGGIYEGETSLGETVEIASVAEDRTLTARFAPAFFSATYGEKWVRLSNCSNNSYWATIEDENGKTAVLDYADEKQLWCLVGGANSFVLYNRAAGDTIALNVPLAAGATNYSDGDAAKLTSDKGTWKLIEQDFGYALVPTAASSGNTKGINMFGGNGGDLKLWGSAAANTGTYWVVEMADMSKPLTLNVEVDQVWASSPRVAELTFTVNGKASATRILGNVEGQKLYLPAGATYEVSSMTYRGYTYNEYEEADGVLTVSYTANEERTLYYNYGANGKPYRIPAIATAPNGHIFGIADNRPCGMDIGYGEVDIKCRISTDNGYSWGEEFFIADGKGGSTNEMTTGFGDAAIVADREQNKLLVMMVCGRTVCHNGRWDKSKIGDTDADAVNRVSRIYLTYNETTGEWEKSEIVEMTDHIYSLFLDGETPTVTSMFIGSGKICQSRVVKKNEYYRLYCSMWTRDGGNRVIYSDDFGGSWNVLGKISDRPAPGGDEPKIEELADGTVILSSRKYSGRYFNVFTFKDNTYTEGTWGTAVASNEVSNGLSFGGNSTNGEIYKVAAIRKADGEKCDIMFQSVPTGGSRSDVAVFYKEMQYNADGTNKYTPTTFSQGWTKGIHVSTKGSCYSTMIMQNNGRIGFLFEEHPGDNYSYCIVYIPYTIEELTGDAYSVDEDFVTGIEEVVSVPTSQPSAIYDLMGRKLDKVTEHGIYIVNGQKRVM